MTALAMVANGLNVLFHVLIARLLSPDNYSLLTVIFAVLLIGSVPTLGLQATVTREVATMLAAGQRAGAALIVRSYLRTAIRVGVVLLAIGLIIAIPLVSILNIEQRWAILATFVAIIVALPLPVVWGALQADHRFTALSLNQTGFTFSKLIGGLGLAALGFGPAAVVFAIAATTLATLAIGWWRLGDLRHLGTQGELAPRSLIGRYAAAAAAGLVLHNVLVSSDLLWSRIGLDGGEAGNYAAASVATSALLLVPVGVTTVLFPHLVRHGRGDEERRMLQVALLLVAALSAIGVGIFYAIPTPLVRIAFGSDYLGAADLLGPLGIAIAGYALAITFLNHFLALGVTRYVIVLGVAAALQQVLFAVHHGSAHQLIAVQIAVSAGVLVASIAYAVVSDTRTRRASVARA